MTPADRRSRAGPPFPLSTTCPWAATVPLSTLVTNSVALWPEFDGGHVPRPVDSAPVIVADDVAVGVENVRRRRCACAPIRRAPAGCRRSTKPLPSTARAVVRPTAGVDVERRDDGEHAAGGRDGEISTMLEPVPCWLAALLKLETSTSPRTSLPTAVRDDGDPVGVDVALGRAASGHRAGDTGEGVQRTEERAGGGSRPGRDSDGDRQRNRSGRPCIWKMHLSPFRSWLDAERAASLCALTTPRRRFPSRCLMRSQRPRYARLRSS